MNLNIVKHILLAAIFCFLSATPLPAQEIMTIEKAISIGLDNNYGIKISEENIAIAENNNVWVKTGRTPTVDLTGSFVNNMTRDNNPASFLQGTFYTGSLGVTASANWVVYNGGRFQINKEQLALTVDQQQLNKLVGIHDLLRTIYQNYYNVIFQQEQLGVLEEVLELSKDRLAYELVKKEFGTSNAYNLIQFESSILADRNQIVGQLQNIETAKRNLYTTLNLIGYPNYVFEDILAVLPTPIDENQLKKTLDEENYTLKTLEMTKRVQQLNTQLAKVAHKPTVSLSGSLGFAENGFKFFADNPQTGEPFDFLFSNRITGGLNANLSYNLYDGGNRKIDIQNAERNEAIADYNLLQAKANLHNQLDLLVSNYESQLELLSITGQQLALAERNITISEERFKAGQITSLDFRNVQNQYLNAAFAKVTAIYNLVLTKNEIDYLVGGFTRF